MKKVYFLFLLLISFLLITCSDNDNTEGGNIDNVDDKDDDDDDDDDDDKTLVWNVPADKSSGSITGLFWNTSGYFNYDSNGKTDFHYWPQAHALDVLVDAYLRTGNSSYIRYFDQWIDGVKAKNGNTYRNDFYDDMEWIALAMLRTYQATKNTKYKDATLQIWEYIKEGWNENGGGGVTWKRGEPTKNSCSNGPACILAARLYQEFGDNENKEWATDIYNWQKSTLVNMDKGIVYDHLNYQTGEIKKDWIFTYNQGTFAGSAVELYKISGDKAYLADAVKVADYTITSMIENSVLKSEGTGDGGLFKGIFIRYFTELIRLKGIDSATKKRYVQFMKLNAETLWNIGTTQPAVLFGPNWRQKPGATTGLTEQLSGCMLIEAIALLEKEGLLD